jgi:hypothetical protein
VATGRAVRQVARQSEVTSNLEILCAPSSQTWKFQRGALDE